MINGFNSYDEIRSLVARMRDRGFVWNSPQPATSLSFKYKPKKTLDQEIRHQRKMLKEANGELKASKIGTKIWRRKKIRVSIVKRLLNQALEKQKAQ